MAVYNAEKYLSEAVDSILSQTFGDFEFIIIDDGSTDQSWAILESFGRRDQRLLLHKQSNAGLIDSLNRACSLARGTYVARMDADDISLPRRFERQVAFLEKNKDIGVVGTWIQDIGSQGEPGPIWPLPTTAGTIRWFLMFGNCLAHPSVMMRRDLIQRLGYNSNAMHVEDYDLWIRACDSTGLANISEVLVKYRVLSHSVSSRNLSVQQNEASRLQNEMKAGLLKPAAVAGPVVTTELLLRLYDAYCGRHSPSRGDRSEIVLDVFRRVYLMRQMRTAWMRLLPLAPALLSLQVLRKTVRFGFSYIRNSGRGFTTQRQLPD
jgi:glycosyltransferase involved in cell wall biosynthesis